MSMLQNLTEENIEEYSKARSFINKTLRQKKDYEKKKKQKRFKRIK